MSTIRDSHWKSGTINSIWNGETQLRHTIRYTTHCGEVGIIEE